MKAESCSYTIQPSSYRLVFHPLFSGASIRTKNNSSTQRETPSGENPLFIGASIRTAG
jgi:hypothetical protein